MVGRKRWRFQYQPVPALDEVCRFRSRMCHADRNPRRRVNVLVEVGVGGTASYENAAVFPFDSHLTREGTQIFHYRRISAATCVGKERSI